MNLIITAILASIITLASPDGKTTVSIDTNNGVTYSVSYKGAQVIAPSEISMTLDAGTVLGSGKLKSVKSTSVDRTISTVIYKKASVKEQYNETILSFSNCDIVFRAYNGGVAYRFVVKNKKAFKVTAEKAQFAFPDNWKLTVPYVIGDHQTIEEQFTCSFENIYKVCGLQDWDPARIAFAPVLVTSPEGINVCITEADLFDYAGMFLYNGDKDNTLEGLWAPYPEETHQGGHNMLEYVVDKRADYIAKYNATKSGLVEFPWRALAITDKDWELADNDLVYLLAKADDGSDWSWVKPGKVAWEWWNDWNIKGVDFESGVNNDTYKFYIDFAGKHGIEYVILDEGWSVNGAADLFQVVPEIDLEELIAYAAKRNVGIILWAGHYALNRDIEKVCKYYAEMGVKGFKVDFMDSDNQQTVEFLTECARIGAKYHLLMDFHGAYKPTGLHRTYPNVINFEGIHGLENMKWREKGFDQVTYDVQVPFIRFVAGPADYTQGAMRNASMSNYYPCYSEPMSQGTRCRQLAEYVVFSSPLNMLCDTPVNYMAEPECTDYIANVPTTWDETVAIDGKVGEYVIIARRKGSTWYIGAMNGLEEMDITLDLSQFNAISYELFKDGANAKRIASDYKKIVSDSVPSTMTVHLAPAGGCVLKLKSSRPLPDADAILSQSDKNLVKQSARKYKDWSNPNKVPETLTLGVITDLHGDAENLGRFISCCNKMSDIIDDRIQLGDIVDSWYGQDFEFYKNTPGTEKMLLVIGNHDTRAGMYSRDWLCHAGPDAYQKYFAPFSESWVSGVVQPENAAQEGKCWYYKDYPAQKVRLIGLDCMSWGDVQTEWFKSVLEDARVKGLSVICAQHLPVGSVNPVSSFNSKDYESFAGSYSGSPASLKQAVDQFMANGGEFVCWFSGDSHYDFAGTLNDYPKQFSITFENGSCNAYWNDSERIRGAKSQDSFNIVTIDTYSKLLKVVRIGNDCDRYLTSKKYFCVNYLTGELISNK